MKISKNWLQKYFENSLPSAEEISEALTFHAFEIEDVGDDGMDVKVLPNRAADCLCHRGIAKELSAILDLPLKNDPLREFTRGDTSLNHEESPRLVIEIEDPKKQMLEF